MLNSVSLVRDESRRCDFLPPKSPSNKEAAFVHRHTAGGHPNFGATFPSSCSSPGLSFHFELQSRQTLNPCARASYSRPPESRRLPDDTSNHTQEFLRQLHKTSHCEITAPQSPWPTWRRQSCRWPPHITQSSRDKH